MKLVTERPTVVWFRYTVEGRILGRDYSDDAQDIRRARGSVVRVETMIAAT